MSIYCITPSLWNHVGEFLPLEDGDHSYSTRGMMAKVDLDGGTYATLIAVSSCNKLLRRILFDAVFWSIKLGENDERTEEYKDKMKWMLESGSEVLAYARHVSVYSFLPEAFEVAKECLTRMTSLRKYTHASWIGIPPIFVPVLLELPNLTLLLSCIGTVHSFPALDLLSYKLNSLEVQICQGDIEETDCLDFCARVVRSKDGTDPGGRASIPNFRRAVVSHLAKTLAPVAKNIKTLYLDMPPWERDQMDKNWFEEAVGQAKLLMKNPRFSMPSLTRFFIEDAYLTPSLLKEILAGSPFLTHLALSPLRKAELETKMPALPMLKRLNIFAQECPKRFPAFYSTVLVGASLSHAYLNGLMPLDLGDLLTSPGVQSAASLVTLEVWFDGDRPLRPYHLEKLARLCVNLRDFTIGGARYEGDPPEFFNVLSELPNLMSFTWNHPWDSSAVGASPLWIHDGKYIRSEAAGSFHILSCAGTSINEEVERRIREDLDGCRPTYVKRFCAVARAHASLQTLVWNPTAEVSWTWTFFRDGEKLKYRQKAVIDYDRGPEARVPQNAVLMTGSM